MGSELTNRFNSIEMRFFPAYHNLALFLVPVAFRHGPFIANVAKGSWIAYFSLKITPVPWHTSCWLLPWPLHPHTLAWLSIDTE